MGEGIIIPAERFPDLFYCRVPHNFTNITEGAMVGEPHGDTEPEINVYLLMY